MHYDSCLDARATHECQSPKSFSPLTISHSARPNASEISLPLPSFPCLSPSVSRYSACCCRIWWRGGGRLWIKDNTYQTRLYFLPSPPPSIIEQAILMSILGRSNERPPRYFFWILLLSEQTWENKIGLPWSLNY